VSATNPRLLRALLSFSGRPSADPRDVFARLERALAAATAPAAAGTGAVASAQLVGDVHDPDSYRTWRRRQLQRLAGAFVPEMEGHQALVLWALKPAILFDFLREGRSKGLLGPPHVGFFNAGVAPEVMLAGTLAGWLEARAQPPRLAPPLLRTAPAARPRLALTQFAWELPGTELFAA
jgi:hypothetical protein